MSKKSYIIIVLVLSAFFLNAQENKLFDAIKYYQEGKLEKAQLTIDSTVSNPETAFDPRTWFYKGWIYTDIYKQSGSATAREVAVKALKKFLQFESVTELQIILKDNQGNLMKSLITEPTEKAKNRLAYLASTYNNEVVEMLNRKQQEGFQAHINLCEQYKDTMIEKTMTYEKSNETLSNVIADYERYKETVEIDIEIYKKNKEVEIEKYKEKMDVATNNHKQCKVELQSTADEYKKTLILAIDVYEKYKETLTIIDSDRDFSKENIQFFLTIAGIYTNIYRSDTEKNKDFFTKAQNYYRFVIDADSNNYDANLQLGILFYNEAVEIAKNLDFEMDILSITLKENDMVEFFTKSLPYMQKAYNLNPVQVQPLLGLSSIYRGLYEYDKALNYSEKAYQIDSSNKEILEELLRVYYYVNEIEKKKTIQKELKKLE